MSDIPVKPTQRSTRQAIEARTAAGSLPEIASVLDRLDAYRAAREALEVQRGVYASTELVRRRDEIDRAVEADLDAIVADVVRAATRALDQEEGRMRAASLEIDAGAASRAQLMTAQVAAASDVDAVLSTFEDAMWGKNDDVIRIVGTAAEGRLRELALKDTGTPTSPAKVAHLGFVEKFKQWQRANPTPRQRIEAIGRERHNRTVAIQEAARLAARLYGIRPALPAGPALRPVPETSPSRIKEGPGFDTLLGRNTSIRR